MTALARIKVFDKSSVYDVLSSQRSLTEEAQTLPEKMAMGTLCFCLK
jgi:hypothetical protein